MGCRSLPLALSHLHHTCRRDRKTQIRRGAGDNAGLWSYQMLPRVFGPVRRPPCWNQIYRCLSVLALFPARALVPLGDHAPWAQPASSLGTSALPLRDYLWLRGPSSAPWHYQVTFPRSLLSAFSTPLHSLFCVLLSKERTNRKCGKHRHHGRKFICLGAFQHWRITSLWRSVHAVLSHLSPQGISLTHTPHLCLCPGAAITNEPRLHG